MTEKQIQRMVEIIIEMHWQSYLSEGQVAKATGLERLEIRKRLEAIDDRRMK